MQTVPFEEIAMAYCVLFTYIYNYLVVYIATYTVCIQCMLGQVARKPSTTHISSYVLCVHVWYCTLMLKKAIIFLIAT